MISRGLLGLGAAIVAAGLAGCVSTGPMVLGGQVVPVGTPVAIRGQLYTNEYDAAVRMLRRHDFVLVKDDAPMPHYVFYVEMPLTLRPGTPSYCQIEMLRDGKPVQKAVSSFVEGQILQPSVAPGWHVAAFEQALETFGTELSHAH